MQGQRRRDSSWHSGRYDDRAWSLQRDRRSSQSLAERPRTLKGKGEGEGLDVPVSRTGSCRPTWAVLTQTAETHLGAAVPPAVSPGLGAAFFQAPCRRISRAC